MKKLVNIMKKLLVFLLVFLFIYVIGKVGNDDLEQEIKASKISYECNYRY